MWPRINKFYLVAVTRSRTRMSYNKQILYSMRKCYLIIRFILRWTKSCLETVNSVMFLLFNRTGKLFVNHLSGCFAACWAYYPLGSSSILSLVQTTKSVSKIVRTTALGGHRCEYFTTEGRCKKWFFCYFIFQVLIWWLEFLPVTAIHGLPWRLRW